MTNGISKRLRLVYKPHSVQRIVRLCSHLSGQRVTTLLGAAYPGLASKGTAETSSLPSSADDFAPAWPCSRRGLPGRLHYCKRRWSLTPPFHHHPHPKGRAVCFCGPFRQVRASRGFPAPDVIRRRALWSADFPRSRQRRTATAQPT